MVAYRGRFMKELNPKQLEVLQIQMQALQEAIEHMPEQISATILAALEVKQLTPSYPGHVNKSRPEEKNQHSFLLDEDLPSSMSRTFGHDIAPEAQVQRLTAQLTAAYNRIAALEEQLLSQRMSQ